MARSYSSSSSFLSGVNSLTCKDKSPVASQLARPISGSLQESLPAPFPQSACVGADLLCVLLATSLSLHLQRSSAGELRHSCSKTAAVGLSVPVSISSTLEKAWTRALSLTSLCSLQRLGSATSPGGAEPNSPVTCNSSIRFTKKI